MILTAGCILYNDENKILLAKRVKAPFKDSWAIVGGKAKEGETVEMSEIAMCTLRASTHSKQAISEHGQRNLQDKQISVCQRASLSDTQELCRHALRFSAEFLTIVCEEKFVKN